MANTKDIRNICLLGHGSSGKTSLAEALLYFTKNTDRLGKITEGNTVSDYDQEEIKRLYSIQLSILPFNWKNAKINLIDTPGFFDFIGEVNQGLRIADCSLIVIDAKSGVEVGTEFGIDFSDETDVPKAFFINKLDEENVNFDKIIDNLRENYGVKACPVFIPHIENVRTAGYVDLISMKYYIYDKTASVKQGEIPANFKPTVEKYKEMLFESLAETDENLMEKYFSGEAFTEDEMKTAFRAGISGKSMSPVFCGSSVTLAGVEYLADSISAYFPSPLDKVNEKAEKDGKTTDVKIDENGSPALFVFKTVADPFVGKMSFFKVMTGTIKKDAVLNNLTSGQPEKLAHIYTIKGKKQTEVDTLACGDIGVTAKLAGTNTNDTLAVGNALPYKKIEFPVPFLTNAIMPKAKGDEDKISTGINRLLEEDLTIRYENNGETHQMLISGLGEIHIDIITSKLKNRFGTSVEFAPPRIAYRETIKKAVKVEGKHKKQSGGHGQYGHVWIEFSRGEEIGLTFTESIFGGSVPKSFHPAVEKGLQECIKKGVLAGYPMVYLKANLFDGSYHDVDSSEMSFKLAAGIAYREGLKNANPIILEPVGELKVYVPDSIVGDIIGDLNKRRGRVMGMNPSETKRGYTVVEAEVPSAEMQTYTVQLRAMSQGRGRFEFTFTRYDEAPAAVAAKVVEEAKKLAAEEE